MVAALQKKAFIHRCKTERMILPLKNMERARQATTATAGKVKGQMFQARTRKSRRSAKAVGTTVRIYLPSR